MRCFRHLLWTGDLEFARKIWPVIERHLAWERRLFRREFGPDKLPLYEAYAAIWASDDIEYHGGGVSSRVGVQLLSQHDGRALAPVARPGSNAVRTRSRADREGDAEISLARRTRDRSPSSRICSAISSCIPAAGCGAFITRWIRRCPRRARHGRWRAAVERNCRGCRCAARACPTIGLITLPSTDWMPYSWSRQQRRHGRGHPHGAGLLAGGQSPMRRSTLIEGRTAGRACTWASARAMSAR